MLSTLSLRGRLGPLLASIALLSAAQAQVPVLEWQYENALHNTGNSYNAARIAVDPNGYVHMANELFSHATLLGPGGNKIWSVRLAPTIVTDRGVDVGFDSAGNTFILTAPPANERKYIRVSKVALNGTVIYNVLYSIDPNNANLRMTPTTMAVSSDGTAYVAGYSRTNVGVFADAFLVQLSPTGSVNWLKTWNGNDSKDEIPVKVMIHPGGGVIVGVNADTDDQNGGTKGRSAALRYAPDGSLLWATTGPSAIANERARAMAVAPNGDAVVVGDGGSPRQLSVLRLDSTGGITLQATWNDAFNVIFARAVAFDSALGFSVTGQEIPGGAFTQKWNAAGQVVWTNTFLGPAEYSGDTGIDVKVDPSTSDVYALIEGNFFINPSTIAPQMYVIKYSANGNTMWLNSDGAFHDGAVALALNKVGSPRNLWLDSGRFYASGWVQTTVNDAWVGKFVDEFVPVGLSFARNPVAGSGTVNATVTLSHPAPPAGITVFLHSPNPALVLPTSIDFPSGVKAKTCLINFTNNGTTRLEAPVKAYIGSDAVTKTLHLLPLNDAEFVGQLVPTSMTAGQSYPVSLQFKNTGNSTWSAQALFRLQSVNPLNNNIWGVTRLALTNGPIAPGATGTFAGIVNAPTSSGVYNFQWQPLLENLERFGQLSANVSITATVAPDAARFVSKACPVKVPAGRDFQVLFSFRNVGSNTWSPAQYSLRSIYNYWGAAIMPLPNAVGPSQQVTFSRILTAPVSPGIYNIQWSMYRNGWFGDKTPLQTIKVEASQFNNLFVSQTVPTTVQPGANFNTSLSYKNVGTAPWGTSGFQFALKSQDPSGNTRWGTAFVPLTVPAAPGQVSVFSSSFTAPSIPGVYAFQWRMTVDGGTGPTTFGQYSPSVAITVPGDNSRFVSRTGPTNVTPGQNFIVKYSMKNTGTTTWSSGSGYSFISLDPQGNSKWGTDHGNLSASVASGASTEISINCTAPVVTGDYSMQWQMIHGGVLFGEATPLVNITVALPLYNSQFLGQSGIPTTIAHGASFVATIQFKNTGSESWSAMNNDYLRSQSPTGNTIWGIDNILPVGTTATGQTLTFTKTFKAPSTPGTYQFAWRLFHDGVPFGQGSQSVTITVT